jgi:hypothetical protein
MNRRGAVMALVLAAVFAVGACEEVGAPEAYRSQVCAIVRSLAGPVPSAVQNLTATPATGDRTATLAALDTVDGLVATMNKNLVDVPLWQTGAPAVADLRKIAAAYTTAAASVRSAVTAGDAGAIQAGLTALTAAGSAAPTLGDSLHAARVKGLNC